MIDAAAITAVPALDHLDEIGTRVLSAGQIGLFLDFDGTISHIVPSPGDAELDPEIREILQQISIRPDFVLGIVSGRALCDIRKRVGMPELVYVGNHGLEIDAGRKHYQHPASETMKQDLRCIFLQLKFALSDIEGVEIEDKALTISVHFRRVHQELHEWVRKTTFELVERSRGFVARPGNMVIEVLPSVRCNKGTAVQWICRELLRPSALTVYIGDDVSDEDVFAAIGGGGVNIRVGEVADTTAQYLLPDVPAVAKFLSWMLEVRAPMAPVSFANAQCAGG